MNEWVAHLKIEIRDFLHFSSNILQGKLPFKKASKSPGDGQCPWTMTIGPCPSVKSDTEVSRHKITVCWGIFVAGARNTMCWWWKMRDAARRNPSHNRSTSPPSLATLLPLLPSLATLDTINQRFATGTKKRPLAGYCLFAKYDLLELTQVRSLQLHCLALLSLT